MQLEFKDFVIC